MRSMVEGFTPHHPQRRASNDPEPLHHATRGPPPPLGEDEGREGFSPHHA